MSDRLRMDFINSLPQPFLVKFGGRDAWWPVNDFEVQTALVRIDVCGKLEAKNFVEVTHIQDGNGNTLDPDIFWSDYEGVDQ